MPEAVGVVQPKPRNIPDMRPKSVSSVTQPAVLLNYDGPRYPGTVSQATTFIWLSLTINSQRKLSLDNQFL